MDTCEDTIKKPLHKTLSESMKKKKHSWYLEDDNFEVFKEIGNEIKNKGNDMENNEKFDLILKSINEFRADLKEHKVECSHKMELISSNVKHLIENFNEFKGETKKSFEIINKKLEDNTGVVEEIKLEAREVKCTLVSIDDKLGSIDKSINDTTIETEELTKSVNTLNDVVIVVNSNADGLKNSISNVKWTVTVGIAFLALLIAILSIVIALKSTTPPTTTIIHESAQGDPISQTPP